MAEISVNSIVPQQALAPVAERTGRLNLNKGNRQAKLPAELKTGITTVNGEKIDTDIVNANIGNADALKGEAIKSLPNDILLKALKEAGIAQNSDTIAMVKALIKENLPLTEKNISDLMLHSYLFRDTPLDTLSLMMRLDVPVTESNIKQLEDLMRTNDNLLNKINNLVESMPAEIISNSDNLSSLSSSLSKLVSFVKTADLPSLNSNANTAQNTALAASLDELMNAVSEKSSLQNTSNTNGIFQRQNTQQTLNNPVLNNSEMRELVNNLRELKAPAPLINRVIELNRQTGHNAANTALASDEILDVVSKFVQEIEARTQIETQTVTLPSESNTGSTKNSGVNGQRQGEYLKGSSRTTIEDIGGRKELFEVAERLLGSKSFSKIMKASIEDKWLIKPQNFNISEVESYFERLNETLNKLDQQLKPSEFTNQHTSNSNITSEAKNIQDNMRLISDLNKNMQFMQIPLKLSSQITNSDLYVLTRKKKDGNGKTVQSDRLNILLKLELNNLGNVDIFINVSGQSIRSRFFSVKDESLEIIKEYLPELNDSITKMGFNFRSSVTKTEQHFDFVEDFINRELPSAEFRKYALNIKI